MNNVRWEPVDDGQLGRDDELGVAYGVDGRLLWMRKTGVWGTCGAELPTDIRLCRAVPIAAPEPDWSQAPEWAMWWAVDSWGIRLWFQREPRTDMGKWREPLHGESLLEYDGPGEELPLGVDWRTTLRKRPEDVR